MLQCRDKYYSLRTHGYEYYWRDAGVEDLKDYYEQLCKISNPCVSPEFDRLRAVANLSKNAGPT